MSAKKKTLQNICKLLSTLYLEWPQEKGQQHENHICTILKVDIDDTWDPFSPHDKSHLKQVKPLLQVSQTFH